MNELFRDKNFRLLFWANLLSNCGQGMTYIGIPWYISKHSGGATQIGTLMSVSALIALTISLYFGLLIDRYKRKTLIQVENTVGLVLQCSLALIGIFFGVEFWQLYVSYICTSIIFQLHYPTLYALTQEAFDRKHYQHLSSVLEVIGQIAWIGSGIIGAFIFDTSHGIEIVLALDGLTYLASLFIFIPFRYDAIVGIGSAVHQESFEKIKREFSLALAYLKTKPRLFTFGLSLYMPFVCLIVVDLINPFFVQKTLGKGAEIFATMETLYSFGALLAGIFARRIASAFGDKVIYISAFAFYFIGLILNVSLATALTGSTMMLLMGWSNATCRVSRVAVFMHIVPTEFQGRVSTLLNSTSMLIRVGLMLITTLILGNSSPQVAYLFIAFVIALSFLAFWWSHHQYLDVYV